MAKNTKSKGSLSTKSIKPVDQKNQQNSLPPGAEKKLKAIKKKLDEFKDKVLDKFGDYIVGITLLPQQKQPESKDSKEKCVERFRAHSIQSIIWC